jgi:hypothetical protein
LASVKAQLRAMFKIEYLSDLSKLLVMNFTRDRSARTISLDHSKYFHDILAKHNMTYCKLSPLPMDSGFLSGLARMDSRLLTEVAKAVYPNLMGTLQYIAICTRPDIYITLSILGFA